MEKETVNTTARMAGKSKISFDQHIKPLVENILSDLRDMEMHTVLTVAIGKKKYYFLRIRGGYVLSESTTSFSQLMPESYK